MAFTISSVTIGGIPTSLVAAGTISLKETEINKQKVPGNIKQYVSERWQRIPVPNKPKVWNIRLRGHLVNDQEKTDLLAIDDDGRYTYNDGFLSLDTVVIIDIRVSASADKRVYDFELELEQYDQT